MKSVCVMLSLLAIAVVGCGKSGPPTGTVTGKVTVGGAVPSEPIRVNFINSNIGQGSAGTTNKDGVYRLENPIRVADYTIYFEKIVDSSKGPVSTADETLKSVPKEFRTEASSTMKKSVKEGANTIDLEVPAADPKAK